jgi:chemotaxis protein methyltransferase CheR
MVLQEISGRLPGFDYRLLGTDVSTRVLEHARTAIYGEERVTTVPIPFRQRYLLRSKDPDRRVVRIASVLRRKASFQHLNFMADSYGVRESFSAIFFRNVMIYFDRETQASVVNKLCRNLRRSGHLFIGHSESLGGLDVPLRQVGPAVYLKV